MELKKFLEEYRPQLENNFLSNEERLRLIKIYDSLEDKPETFDDWLLEHTPPETIDYMFPYVDYSDPIWRKKFFKVAENFDSYLMTDKRFDGDKTLLRCIFKGIELYMPWIGIIHFIISEPSQIPEWLDQDKIHVVYHKDFIPNCFLPTFNSCTIEIFLHRVIGLSEKFIYGNDDFYPIGPMDSSDFFKKDKPVTELNYQYWKYAFHSTENLKMAEQCTKILKDGVRGTKHFVPHIPLSFLKSLYKSIYKEFENFIIYTISPFRKLDNASVYFYYYVMFLRNEYEESLRGPRYRVWTGDEKSPKDLIEMLDILDKKTVIKNYWQILVINSLQNLHKTLFLSKLLNYYNFISKFEKR